MTKIEIKRLKRNKYMQKYNKTLKRKLYINNYMKKYNKTPKRKLANKLYQNKYRNRPEIKLSRKVYKHNRGLLTKGLTLQIIQQVYEDNIHKYNTLTCELCFKPIEFGQDSLEHFIPLSRGGSNESSNLGVAHGNNSVEKCNTKKGNKTIEEYILLTT